jgi:GNAT superfamily N-acetyltransferase
LDDFASTHSVEEIAEICSAVGFNTIPAWLRPYAVLSTGERFRVGIARALLESPDPIIVDEFSSVVDRQVAQITSAAVSKYVRKHGRRFVAVSCHYDIVEWLNPDWVLEPETMTFSWRSLRRRPQLDGEIVKVDHEAWRLFAPYHYLSAELASAAQCYLLLVAGQSAAFAGLLYRPVSIHKRGAFAPIWGVSRVVTLPDYQGLGLAFVLTDALGAAFAALGARFRNYPAHPSYVRSLARSPSWRLVKRPGLIRRNGPRSTTGRMGGRPNAVFEFVGPAMADADQARALLAIPSLSAT